MHHPAAPLSFSPLTPLTPFTLEQKYTQADGVVLISGIQALVRALHTRAQLDAARGLQTGGFVSGYRGSPLGGLDKTLWQQQTQLLARNIHFQPGVNEDLAATAVWGSQQVGLHAGAKVDGVFGLWYGKTPGLDRSCDAIRHANAWGTSAHGGVLLVVGDDPAAKSSSLATQSEFALQDMMLPVLAPADVQEVHDYAVLGWELSRHSGLWVGLKAIADHMDSAATIEVGLPRFQVAAAATSDVHIRREDTPTAQEQRLLEQKLPAALEFARRAGLNQWLTRAPAAAQRDAERTNDKQRQTLGIIAAGKAYRDVREAFSQLGYHNLDEIRTAGVEILKLGMTWPLDPELLRNFADAVDQLWVVEEKRAFVEPQVKEILYGMAAAPPVSGKYDSTGQRRLPSAGILDVAKIARVLAQVLQLAPAAWLQRVTASEAQTANVNAPAKQERTPLFCAGCPHNTSTRVPEGSRATAGIGCHYMVQWMDRNTDSCTQMGGEGVTWLGEAPFTEEPHIFANLGDGTYFHSGVLAIRQAVAADVNITYKILFNEAVAMTGGQPVDGALTIQSLVQQLRAEGVGRIALVGDAPEALAETAEFKVPGLSVHHRRELDQVQRTLREHVGVSVIVYQQTCATELRRRRKRGQEADTKPRLMINQAVCEGCGDCSVQSNCVAVEPVETDLGVKRRINQTLCNKDLSCAEGFCPAFVEVQGEPRGPMSATADLDSLRKALPTPQPRQHADILVAGVGGTGIVTLSALLAAGARMDGKAVRTLDMTGLAQKGGAVFSHVRIAEASEQLHTPRIPNAGADVLVACDLVAAASNEALELLHANTQVALNSHVMPTADFVLGHGQQTQAGQRIARLKRVTRHVASLAAEETIEACLGDAQQANIMLLGYAYQLGGIPLTLPAVERAIELNGVAVERNLLAFHLGRAAVADPSLVPDKAPDSSEAAPQTLQELLPQRAAALAVYQDEALAQRYRQLLARVAHAEQTLRPGSEQLTRAVAESYYRLLAVKDEYEVARLLLDKSFNQQLHAQFGAAAKVKYLLAPPALGTRKRRFGPWVKVVFRVLKSMRFMRNTRLDPFAYTAERRQAVQLLARFEALLEEILPALTLQNLSIAVALARLPLQVRGFGYVKAAAIEKAERQQQQLLQAFRTPPTPVIVFDPGKQAA